MAAYLIYHHTILILKSFQEITDVTELYIPMYHHYQLILYGSVELDVSSSSILTCSQEGGSGGAGGPGAAGGCSSLAAAGKLAKSKPGGGTIPAAVAVP